MPPTVEDPEVDRLAERLAALRRVSKTEAVRVALEREGGAPSLVERGVAFVAALKARARTDQRLAADKAFIDSLCE